MHDREKTGALIASVRREKRMTQKELAGLLHISDTTVSKWERGVGFPDVSLVEPLAAALGLTIAELFAGERKAEPMQEACEALLLDVIAESGSQNRARRRQDRAAFLVALAIILLIAVPLLFFRAESPPLMRGTYTALLENGVSVQLAAGWADMAGEGKYVLHIDSRAVEEGRYAPNRDGSFTLTGAWADGMPRVFLAEPDEDGAFRLLLPALQGGAPVRLEKVGDVPAYIGGAYGDEAAYREKYLNPTPIMD